MMFYVSQWVPGNVGGTRVSWSMVYGLSLWKQLVTMGRLGRLYSGNWMPRVCYLILCFSRVFTSIVASYRGDGMALDLL